MPQPERARDARSDRRSPVESPADWLSPADLLKRGSHIMTVCNACRYCEQYCPVFPAMEERLVFGKTDLAYLANLCHNCGECLYACQFAPPHEFGIDVPRVLAQIRLRTYEEYCWPGFMAGAFRRSSVAVSLGLSLLFTAVLCAAVLRQDPEALWRAHGAGEFYAVIPHTTLIALFGAVSTFVLAAFAVGASRCWQDMKEARQGDASKPVDGGSALRALRDALTLRHLHASGDDCTRAEEERTPWRRYFHHFTFYGFLLCFASTTTAAFYHTVLQRLAPYPYGSLPVVLGVLGGIGLLVGPLGLLAVRRRQDAALRDPAQQGMDGGMLALLLVVTTTGLALLALRETAAMAALLLVHLGAVLAFFVTLPYGKFVHAVYRTLALLNYAHEQRTSAQKNGAG